MALYKSVGLGGYDGGNLALVEGVDQIVRIVGLVGKKGFRVDLFEQRLGLAKIGSLARGEGQGSGVAQSIDDDVYLRCQTTSGSSDGLAFAVFFRAPALC